ncbi:hypothetical protein M5K25_026056 [Dendrobium thyrsiflorum]|uniref:Uncharacterized protein n=1 Tax=Dendrobium thyrsiflorum TaxID=117978 RepID=A0ABD0TWH5_DENTH
MNRGAARPAHYRLFVSPSLSCPSVCGQTEARTRACPKPHARRTRWDLTWLLPRASPTVVFCLLLASGVNLFNCSAGYPVLPTISRKRATA